MKKTQLLKIFLLGPAILWMAGCQHRSPNTWDDQPNGTYQQSKKTALLYGKAGKMLQKIMR
ncbi:MAG: hypothetical protein LVR00_08735 [Rhabdochlamydiaceae bacterium]|jgi:hypothetical protein